MVVRPIVGFNSSQCGGGSRPSKNQVISNKLQISSPFQLTSTSSTTDEYVTFSLIDVNFILNFFFFAAALLCSSYLARSSTSWHSCRRHHYRCRHHRRHNHNHSRRQSRKRSSCSSFFLPPRHKSKYRACETVGS